MDRYDQLKDDRLLDADPSKREGIIAREGQIHKDFFYHSTRLQNWYHLNESLVKKIDRDAPQRDYEPFINIIKNAVDECARYMECKFKLHKFETHVIKTKEQWANDISYFPAAFTALYCITVDPESRVIFEKSVTGHPQEGKLFITPALVSFKLQQSLRGDQKYISMSFDVDR